MRKIIESLKIILVCLVSIEYLSANDLTSIYKDWSVDSQNKQVRYVSYGSTVRGHQFGFIKKAGNCNQDLLWISLSTHKKGIKKFQGSAVVFQLSVGNIKIRVETTLIATYDYTPTLIVAGFTNFVANNKMLSLLEQGKMATISILSPKEIANELNIAKESFNLNGFADSRLKAIKICKKLSVGSALEIAK